MINPVEPGRTRELAPLLQPALDANDGAMTLDDVEALAQQDLLRLFEATVNDNRLAAFAIELIKWPRKTGIRVVLAGGEQMHLWIDEWITFLDALKAQVGADWIEMVGRQGWQRVLKDKGYTAHITFRRR